VTAAMKGSGPHIYAPVVLASRACMSCLPLAMAVDYEHIEWTNIHTCQTGRITADIPTVTCALVSVSERGKRFAILYFSSSRNILDTCIGYHLAMPC